MRTLNIGVAVVLAVAVAVFVVSTARGATREDCSHNPSSAYNAISSNAEYGFRPYLLGIGTSWWRGKERLAAPWVVNASQVALCGDAARKVYADQQRFYVLLRAFPLKPTRAQWQARFRPLMQAAIVADTDFLRVGSSSKVFPISVDKAWLVAAQFTPFGKTLE